MSFSQKFSFLLTVLPELLNPNCEESTMITAVLSAEDTFCPELFQVINRFDGTFLIQHLAAGTHDRIFTETRSLDRLASVSDLLVKAVSLNLTWGPDPLFHYTF